MIICFLVSYKDVSLTVIISLLFHIRSEFCFVHFFLYSVMCIIAEASQLLLCRRRRHCQRRVIVRTLCRSRPMVVGVHYQSQTGLLGITKYRRCVLSNQVDLPVINLPQKECRISLA